MLIKILSIDEGIVIMYNLIFEDNIKSSGNIGIDQ